MQSGVMWSISSGITQPGKGRSESHQRPDPSSAMVFEFWLVLVARGGGGGAAALGGDPHPLVYDGYGLRYRGSPPNGIPEGCDLHPHLNPLRDPPLV